MRHARWIDHLPPWMAWGAVASTRIYGLAELALMALPLLLAALVEWRRWGMGRWRRLLEVAALLFLLVMIWARVGLVPLVVQVVFFLCGVRLALPRELAQRRQLLLMGFLVWITTAVTSFSLDFLFWSMAWVLGSSLVMLQQAWEQSTGRSVGAGGAVHRASLEAPPYRRIVGWWLGACLIAACVFLIMPRVSMRMLPWGLGGRGSGVAGLSDSLELGDTGTIQGNGDVVLRILPPPMPEAERLRWTGDLALLRGLVLEDLDGLTWRPVRDAAAKPESARSRAEARSFGGFTNFEFFIAPAAGEILPLPYGKARPHPPMGMPLQEGAGSSLRWRFPPHRPFSVAVEVAGPPRLIEAAPSRARLSLLTQVDESSRSAERWSRREVPGELEPKVLADRLSARLQTFRYTLDNPSGSAANPLEDFLERSHAGHCEYFASALALMLRHRGVPARVVSGYRLGTWVSEGGYWVVTRNEAHSWVEYFDASCQAWQVADPTPGGAREMAGDSLWASLQRWMDSMSYRWDRYVVRFSDEDQQQSLEWLRGKTSGFASGLRQWKLGLSWDSPTVQALAYALLVILGMGGLGWRMRRHHAGLGGLMSLKPLVRVARRTHPPASGETLRQWLQRLAQSRPDRRRGLMALADLAEAEAYGRGQAAVVRMAARQEARAWRRRPGPGPSSGPESGREPDVSDEHSRGPGIRRS